MKPITKKLIFSGIAVLLTITGCIATVSAEETNNTITTTTPDPTAKYSIFYQINNILYEVKDVPVGELVNIADYQPVQDTSIRWTSTDAQIVNNSFVMPDKNVTLIATVVNPNSYSITYYLNGGEINGDYKVFYHKGDTYTLPTDVTKYNDSFVGWYTDPRFIGGKVYEITATDTGDKKFYAKYMADEKYAPSEKYDKITTGIIDPKTLLPDYVEPETPTTPIATAVNTPFPILAVLAGLGIAGYIIARKRR